MEANLIYFYAWIPKTIFTITCNHSEASDVWSLIKLGDGEIGRVVGTFRFYQFFFFEFDETFLIAVSSQSKSNPFWLFIT